MEAHKGKFKKKTVILNSSDYNSNSCSPIKKTQENETYLKSVENIVKKVHEQ